LGWLDALNFFGLDPFLSRTNFSNQDVPDSNTLMIVAGPCGSGKSTLLQAAYKEKLPLFRLEFSQFFSKSFRDRSYREHDDYKVA
jgi:guanylate kinase